jgi:DNA polymerase IIIc chi subunit
MATEINFYQFDEELIKSLAPLLLKVLEEKKKVLVFCRDEKKIGEIDNSLWSYGRTKFIPHITNFDKGFSFERQPILISNKEENLNKADYLVFLDEPSEIFISSFSRAFHFYNSEKPLAKIKPKNSYKKEDGKWVKI